VHILSPAMEKVSGAHGAQLAMDSEALVGEK
jgi:hypothetical protein